MSDKKQNLNISWLSNAPWAGTGYGNQTRLFTPRIRDLGHDVSLTAFYGLEGAILNWHGMRVYPKAFHPYGQDIASAHAQHANADIMITLLDAWVCEPRNYKVKWIPWYPVDMTPLPPPIRENVEKAHARIVFSRFGEQMTREAGLDCYYVPHGVETNVFMPIDRNKAREKVKFPKDAFIVGMVAANKGNPSRKAFCQNIEAFAALKKKRKDAILYLHTCAAEHGENGGVNLVEYCNFIGLEPGKDVFFADQYQNVMGFPDEWMNALYNSFDVHLLVSMGEGFGIPILEAQSAGCPVIVGNWTSMPELCFSGWKVEEANRVWTPLGAYQFDPNPAAIADALNMAYANKGNLKLRTKARQGALAYDADLITEKYWKPTLLDIAEKL